MAHYKFIFKWFVFTSTRQGQIRPLPIRNTCVPDAIMPILERRMSDSYWSVFALGSIRKAVTGVFSFVKLRWNDNLFDNGTSINGQFEQICTSQTILIIQLNERSYEGMNDWLNEWMNICIHCRIIWNYITRAIMSIPTPWVTNDDHIIILSLPSSLSLSSLLPSTCFSRLSLLVHGNIC